MCRKIIITGLYFIGVMLCAQEHKSYVQPIPGTTFEIKMVPIPSGTFKMGSSADDTVARPDEGPMRTLKVDAIWMADAEITWELYKLYLNRTGQSLPDSDQNQPQVLGKTVMLNPDAISGATIPYVDMSLGMGTGPGLPVGNVTRKAAARFCKWLSAKTGHFYRLPTEVEWEYAARAGNSSSYFFGTDSENLENYAWYEGNSQGTYHPIKQKLPNPWGLYDILGNVAEWTMDGYNPEGYVLDTNSPIVPTKEYPGVLRGGSYKSSPEDLRVSARLVSSPVWKQRDPQFPRSKWWFTDAPFAGFRIVRPLHPPDPAEFEMYWDLP